MKRRYMTGFLMMVALILLGTSGFLIVSDRRGQKGMSDLVTVSGENELVESIAIKTEFRYEHEAEEVIIEKGEKINRFVDIDKSKYLYGNAEENRIRGLTEGKLKEFEWNGETYLFQVMMTAAEDSGRYSVVLERRKGISGEWSDGTFDDLRYFRDNRSNFIVAAPEYDPFSTEEFGTVYLPEEASLTGGPVSIVCTETIAFAEDEKSGKEKLYFTASMQDKRRNLASVCEVSDWSVDGTAMVRTAAEWDLTGQNVEIRCLGVRDEVILLGFLKDQGGKTYACIKPYFMEEENWGEEYRICELEDNEIENWVMKMDSSEGVIQTVCYKREYPHNTGGEEWERMDRTVELVSYESDGKRVVHETLEMEGLCDVNSVCRVNGITWLAGNEMYFIDSQEELSFWIQKNRYNRSGIAAAPGFQASQYVRAFDGANCIYYGRWRSRLFESFIRNQGGYYGIYTKLSE